MDALDALDGVLGGMNSEALDDALGEAPEDVLDEELDEGLDEALDGAGGVGVVGVDERASVDGAGEVAGLNTNFLTGAFIRGSADAAAGGLVEGGDGALGSADEEVRAEREGTESEGLRAGFPSSPVSPSADSDCAATPGGVVVGSSFSDEPVKSLEKIPTEFVDSQSYHRPQRDRAVRDDVGEVTSYMYRASRTSEAAFLDHKVGGERLFRMSVNTSSRTSESSDVVLEDLAAARLDDIA